MDKDCPRCQQMGRRSVILKTKEVPAEWNNKTGSMPVEHCDKLLTNGQRCNYWRWFNGSR